jgi:hypothetical protein
VYISGRFNIHFENSSLLKQNTNEITASSMQPTVAEPSTAPALVGPWKPVSAEEVMSMEFH